jgi:hypothetical protein
MSRFGSPKARYWLATLATVMIAAAVSFLITTLGRALQWRFPRGFGFTSFVFVASILHPQFPGTRKLSWPLRMLSSVVLALCFGVAYILISRD